MTTSPTATTIRAKKLGVIIRDARLISRKSLEECAQAIGVPPDKLAAFERGDQSPSLPEIELLALYLDIPLEHFWGNNTLSGTNQKDKEHDPQQIKKLRQRMIGVQLRQARMEAGLSQEKLAEMVGLDAVTIKAYEIGEASIPVPVLETLAFAMRRTVRDFQDRHGPVGVWASERRAIQGLLELTPELQSFVSKPINRPYLELAQRLSEMSVEKLRAVAEGLLEITL